MRLPLSLIRIQIRRRFFSTTEQTKTPAKSEWWYISRGAAGASVILLPLLALDFLYEDVSIRQDFEDWDEVQSTPILPLLREKLGMKIPFGNSIYNASAAPSTDDAPEGPNDVYNNSDETDLDSSNELQRSSSSFSAYTMLTSIISNPWKASYQTARGGLETAFSIKSQQDILTRRVHTLREAFKKQQLSANSTQLDRERARRDLQRTESELLRFQHPPQLSTSHSSISSIFIPSLIEKSLQEDAVSIIMLPTPRDKVVPPPPPSPTIQTSIDNARDWLFSFLPTSQPAVTENDGEKIADQQKQLVAGKEAEKADVGVEKVKEN